MTPTVGPAADLVTEPDRVPALLQMQRELLVKAASGAETGEVLELLVGLIEAYVPEAIGSVLLVDTESQTLRTLVAPSLPSAYSDAIDGVAIRQGAGSCGTAAASKQTVVVEDIATDPLWESFRELALEHGLRACWSTPIVDGADRSDRHLRALLSLRPASDRERPGARRRRSWDRELVLERGQGYHYGRPSAMASIDLPDVRSSAR